MSIYTYTYVSQIDENITKYALKLYRRAIGSDPHIVISSELLQKCYKRAENRILQIKTRK